MADYSYLPIATKGGSSGGSSSASSGKSYSDLPVSGSAQSSAGPQPTSEAFGGLASALGRFATLGLADEAAAGIRSLLPGYQDYDSELAAIQQGAERYEKEFPNSAKALNIVGGVPLAIATAGQGVPSSALAAGGRAALQGAALSGAQAFGEGEDGFSSRMSKVPLAAATGGAIGGGLGYGATKLVDALASPLVQSTANRLRSSLASERGAVSLPNASVADAGIPVEYGVAARRLRATPIDDIEAAAMNMQQAELEGSPMWLAESFPGQPSQNISRLVRGLAQNETTMDPIAQAVSARQAGALERVSGILDEIHPERSAVVAGGELKSAIATTKSELEAARREVATPIYEEQLKPLVFKSKAVKEVIRHPRIEKAIAAVKREFPEFKDLPDTAFPVLDKAKQHLYNSTKGKPDIKVYADNARKSLVRAMEKDKAQLDEAGESIYAQARAIYEEGSTPITAIFGGKDKPLVELAATKAEKVGMRALGFDKEVLANVKKTLGDKGEALVKATRSALQGKIEGMKQNQNLVSDIIEVPAMRDKLRTIIGDDVKFDRLMRLLGREGKYAQSARLYNPGSTTYGNIQEAQNLSEAIPMLTKILTNPLGAAKEGASEIISGMFAPRLNENTLNRLATMLTDTGEGSKFFETMLPYLRQGAAVRETLSPVSKLTAALGANSPASLADPSK